MIYNIENNDIFAKLDKEEEVFESIEKIAEIYKIKGAIIVSGIGMLKNFEIGYFNGTEYIKEKYEKNHELVSFHGTIAATDPKLHIHVALAGPDHRLIGGHLFTGTVDPLLELYIVKTTETVFKREYNRNSGLKELKF
ncbi:MAG: DNA-binding protein [Thermoplasmata archaeon]